MKVVFFSVLSSTPAFLSCPVSQVNNSPKILVNLTKFATEKHMSLQLALNLWHLFTNRQSMRDFLKVIHEFSLLAKYGKVVFMTFFFLKLLLILPSVN